MPLLKVAPNQVTVRMYRIGHGDCFLIAMPRKRGTKAYYVLIDCGYKPGSQAFIHHDKVDEIVDHLHESTGGKIDLFIITHEHQDHCNGIWKERDPYFEKFKIANAWFAWTESPTDDVAIKLRKRHRDVLVGLVEARKKLALAAGEDDEAVQRLTTLLSLESGGEAGMLGAVDPEKSGNKQGMKLVKDKARASGGDDAISYLLPGECHDLPGVAGIRAFVLGPPRDEDLLLDEDPQGSEGFKRLSGASELSFAAAAGTATGSDVESPFAAKFQISKDEALKRDWFTKWYGDSDAEDKADKKEVVSNAPWRRIDAEWLYAAESLALKLNTGINNTSLVLAFELPKSKKILLFVGDAQRGNWISWDDQTWKVDGKTFKAKDLLARTVLYKVGHHGSHNATLDGSEDDDYPNLGWMGQGRHADEFTAMITAVNKWATEKNTPPWVHPLPSIRKALETKTGGRLFQTDRDEPGQPNDVPDSEWKSFMKRVRCEDLFFDYTVTDD